MNGKSGFVMGKLETKRLLLLEYSLEWIQATILGVDELERVSGYEVSRDWPGIDFFFLSTLCVRKRQKRARNDEMDAFDSFES